MIIIAVAVVIVLVIVIYFSSFGFYKVDIYPGGSQKVLVRKVKNENMFMNFLKPSAEGLEHGDIIVYKNPELHDPTFKEKENLYGRIIGLPGDVILIKDSKVFINNQEIDEAYDRYFLFRVSLMDSTDFKTFLSKYKLEIISTLNGNRACEFIATQAVANEIAKINGVINVRQLIEDEDTGNPSIFPKQGVVWNRDYFGPFAVPQKGVTVMLNRRNYPIYNTIISFYEDNQLFISGDIIKIDGKVVENYTLQNNYYFILNDNRYNKIDSRFIGFIPENHIIGKVVN